MAQETNTQSTIMGLLWAKSAKEERGQVIPWHPLWCHLLDVAAVGQALLPRFGSVLPLPEPWLLFLLALHDIGKADAEFQNKDEQQAQRLRDTGLSDAVLPLLATKFRHEARSAEWLLQSLRTRWGWGREAAIVVSQAITGHHGNFQAAAYDEEEKATRFAFWPPLRDALAALVADVLALPPFALDHFPDASVAGIRLSGLIVLADWIASNTDTYDYPSLPKDAAPADYFAAAQALAARSVRDLGLHASDPSPWTGTPAFAQVWTGCTLLRPSQAVLQDVCLSGVPPGLAILEAPMGEGKTEAAIYLAHCWNHPEAYLALPTQATSNQMHTRYEAFLRAQDPHGPSPRLVHGMAWLLDERTPTGHTHTDGDPDEPHLADTWFQPAKRALLAPQGVGTVDQVLMAALHVKHGFLRFLGLSHKTLIIDECHAYDLYMTTLLETLLGWCRALHIPVILLSATLSHEQKRRLAEAYGGPGALPAPPADAYDPYPLLTFVPLEGPARTVPVPPDPSRDRTILVRRYPGYLNDPSATAALAVQSIQNGGCACVLANTVRSAQDIFQALHTLQDAGQLPDTKLLLFHARFRAEARERLEKHIIHLFGKGDTDDTTPNPNRPPRAILVATQVVEQSLDVDFDVMLSQIAPTDLLLQRIGRLHRHAKNNPRRLDTKRSAATLHVLLPPDDDNDFGPLQLKPYGKDWRGVYDHLTLLRTRALLQSRDAFHLPADFRPLIEQCYAPNQPLPGLPAEAAAQAQIHRESRQAQSQEKAKTHLAPEPDAHSFQYAGRAGVVAEAEDGAPASYLRAQTREGDDSRAALILHDPRLLVLIRKGMDNKDYRPSRTTLKRLFRQKASLPAYWLAKGLTPADGYTLIKAGPKWLQHHVILSMIDNRWEGTDEDGQVVEICDDPILGLLRRLCDSAAGLG